MNETRLWRVMRVMGLIPDNQKPNTGKVAKRHPLQSYPRHGLRHFPALMDWHVRKVLPGTPKRPGPMGDKWIGSTPENADIRLCGRPPAVVYWQGIETTQPDQQVQA